MFTPRAREPRTPPKVPRPRRNRALGIVFLSTRSYKATRLGRQAKRVWRRAGASFAGNLTMDFELTEEQRSLRQSVVDFARSELNEDVIERDKAAAFSREAWSKCADLGLLGLPVPKEYGGAGADAVTTMIALEALGYACTDNG